MVASWAAALSVASAATERVAVHDFSVPVPSGPNWEIKTKQDAQVEFCRETGRPRIYLTAVRVKLPEEAATADVQALATKLVRQNWLGYQVGVFRQKIALPKWSETVACEAGTAYVFGDDRPVSPIYAEGPAQFAKVALLLPPHFRTSRTAYLVVGEQRGRTVPFGLDQDDGFNDLLKGLQEN